VNAPTSDLAREEPRESETDVGAEEAPPFGNPDLDLPWLRQLNLGLDDPIADLARLSAEHAYRYNEEVVAAVARFRAALAPYDSNFEELAGPTQYSQKQAKLWRTVFEALKGG
jgi:hypothetical protein